MHIRKTVLGALSAALLISAIPAATLAQIEPLEVTPEGVNWTLTSTDGTAVAAEVEANLYMDEEEANGNTGCNSFSGSYVLDGESLSFGENFAMTQAFCDGVVGETEQAYIAGMTATETWAIEGNQLSLSDGAGAVVLTFEEAIVDVTETDVVALDAALARIQSRLNTLRATVRDQDVDGLRAQVAGNEEVLAEVQRTVKNQNVPALRDRVVANEAVLEELTDRFINLRQRVKDLEERVGELEG